MSFSLFRHKSCWVAWGDCLLGQHVCSCFLWFVALFELFSCMGVVILVTLVIPHFNPFHNHRSLSLLSRYSGYSAGNPRIQWPPLIRPLALGLVKDCRSLRNNIRSINKHWVNFTSSSTQFSKRMTFEKQGWMLCNDDPISWVDSAHLDW